MKFYPFCLFFFLTACQPGKTDNDQKEEKTGDTSSNAATTPNIGSKNLPDSLLKGELIDGPANVRDTVSGRLLFSLNNNVPVTTTDTLNKWIQVGIFTDVNNRQYKSRRLEKGDTVYLEGNPVGIVLERTTLQACLETKEGLKGELVGYTSARNIKSGSIPEFALAGIINQGGSLTPDDFTQYFKSMGFHKADSKKFKGFQIDENWIDDPSPKMRLWLLFENNKLFAVVHSRKLDLHNINPVKLDEEFSLSVIGEQNPKSVKDFIREFNSFVNQGD